MKSKKEVMMQWMIVHALYIIVSLVTWIITDDWRAFMFIICVSLAYSRGWYKCWKFHNIGWEEPVERFSVTTDTKKPDNITGLDKDK